MTSFKATTFVTFIEDVCHLGAMHCSIMYATGSFGSAISSNNRLARRRVNDNLENRLDVCTEWSRTHNRELTFLPPLPSTTFPLLLSTTLACKSPPRTLSRTLPSVPQRVIAMVHRARSFNPALAQNGRTAADVAETMNEPRRPAPRPVAVTPPFVPGGTSRRFNEVIRRGLDFERMPSSEESVSAATAA